MSGGKLTPTDLAGTYTIISGEKFGHPEPAERVAGSTVRLIYALPSAGLTTEFKSLGRHLLLVLSPRKDWPAGYGLRVCRDAQGGAPEAGSPAGGGKLVFVVALRPLSRNNHRTPPG